MKNLLTILVTLAVAVPITWFVGQRRPAASPPIAHAKPAADASERRVLFYQSSMHPWIKSDQPGRCTICGMELTPIYEGSAPAAGHDVVMLSPSTVQVLHVETTEAARRPLAKTLRVAGVIDDDQRRHRFLSAYADGRIDKLMVNFVGAEVVAGQPLAHLFSPSLLATRDEYLQFLRSGSDPRLAAALRDKLIRFGLTAEQVARFSEQKNPPHYLEILAPTSGTVVAQNVFEGQYVKEGDRLFEIADFSTMWFQFQAYEQDMPWIALGREVDVTTPSHPGQVFRGKVTFIDPNFDEITRATKVRVELSNRPPGHEHRLLHRLYAEGTVHLAAPEALTLPRTAIVQTGTEAVAYVDHGDGHYGRHVVTLGRRGDEFVEALSGLEEGDRIVTNGNLLIDSQAELNRTFSTRSADEATEKAAAFSETERKAIEVFTAAADRIAAALAADDFAAFQRVAPEVASASKKLGAALQSRTALAAPLTKLLAAHQLAEASDLAAARKVFYTFSTAATTVLTSLRDSTGAPQFTIWECPMAGMAVPDAKEGGRWIQAANRSIANPYFGKEMLECGEAVKP